ncbi:hypothetical protein OTU49_003082, partial [Cherax quadricarinatus]
VILIAVAAMAIAAPQAGYQVPQPALPPPEPQPAYGTPDASVPFEIINIIKDERTQKEDGTFSLEFETENGIIQSQSGSPGGPEGAVITSGQYSYQSPDGIPIVVKFVADQNGFQPESDVLPVAPAFPHSIPEYVLEQIDFAAKEDAARAAAEAAERSAAPSQTYSQPQ